MTAPDKRAERGRGPETLKDHRRRRLDAALVAAGLARSRGEAQALVEAGAVRVADQPARRASQPVAAGAALSVAAEARAEVAPYVSRAGQKLAHALDAFGLDVDGAAVLDVGASTGGFTEVCLRRGAARVFALDVGRDQLHPSVRADPRVVDLSGVNARDLDAHAPADAEFDVLVADVSFISLTKALPRALERAAPGARLVALVKPQFEVGPARVGKGGVVKDPKAHADAVRLVEEFLQASGWRARGVVESPLLGAAGNREFLIAADKPRSEPAP